VHDQADAIEPEAIDQLTEVRDAARQIVGILGFGRSGGQSAADVIERDDAVIG
jgi:hypothetical protein